MEDNDSNFDEVPTLPLSEMVSRALSSCSVLGSLFPISEKVEKEFS